MTAKWIETAPLDLGAAAAAYRATGRAQIRGFFTPETAERISDALDQAEYYLTTLLEAGLTDFELDEWRGLSLEAKADALEGLHAYGSESFTYLFETARYDTEVRSGRRTGTDGDEIYDWLNSEAFIAIAEAITGERVDLVDAQATRYRAGHFLTVHTDNPEGRNRRFAYVLNFTRKWRRDWGGNLVFYDDAGNIEAGLVPTFNALNIFRVPKPHSVTHVSPLALDHVRRSITGWGRLKSRGESK